LQPAWLADLPKEAFLLECFSPFVSVAALFYSLIETARLRGEDPGHSLKRAALAAIETPGTVTLPKSQN
jgi:hypothetical protein